MGFQFVFQLPGPRAALKGLLRVLTIKSLRVFQKELSNLNATQVRSVDVKSRI